MKRCWLEEILPGHEGKRKALLLSAIFFLGVCLPRCEKPEEQNTGLGIQPGNDRLGGAKVDSITLHTHTEKESAIQSTHLSRYLLGSYHDPELGRTEAGFYTQLRLPNDNIDLGAPSDLELDSVILSLALDGQYINSNTSSYAQNFEIYELSGSMDSSESYHSNDSVAYNTGDLIGSATLTPDFSSSRTIGGDTLPPHLRVPLNTSFGNKLLNASGSSDLSDNSTFLSFIKGLRVKVNNNFAAGSGSILYLDLVDEASNVTVYYTHNGSQDTTTGKLELEINQDCALFNTYHHQHSTQVKNQLNDTTLGQKETYVQAAAGLRTTLQMPHLKKVNDSGNVAINKAELVVPVQNGSDDAYNPPDRLFVLKVDASGKEQFLSDIQLGDEHIDGFLSNGEYRFNVTRHVQAILNDKEPNRPLRIVSSNEGITTNRVILNGPDASSGQPTQLELTFTKY